jgi:hypothetical protein
MPVAWAVLVDGCNREESQLGTLNFCISYNASGRVGLCGKIIHTALQSGGPPVTKTRIKNQATWKLCSDIGNSAEPKRNLTLHGWTTVFLVL